MRRRDREKEIRRLPVLEGRAADESDTAVDTGWAPTAFPDCRTPRAWMPADEGTSWHPALASMAAVASRWIDRNDSRGWDVLEACAILNGSPRFARDGVQ